MVGVSRTPLPVFFCSAASYLRGASSIKGEERRHLDLSQMTAASAAVI